MRKTVARVLALLGVLGAPDARAATCVVTDVTVVVSNYSITASIPELVGHAFPVTIDPTPGSFQLDFSGFPTSPFSMSGIPSDLHPATQRYDGTIDGAGNVVVPGVNVSFTTHLASDVLTETTATLMTGMSSRRVGPKDYAIHGTPLDFGTRRVTLAGTGLIPSAPLAAGPVVAGMALSCTLDAVPAASALPAGMTIAGVSAKGRFGKSKSGSIAGDSIVVKGKLRDGAAPIDPLHAETFVQMPARPGHPQSFLLTHASAGALTAKGKTASLSDTDGTVLRLVEGQKQVGNDFAPVSGQLTFRTIKGGRAFVLKQTGVDLCTAPTTAPVTVTLGTSVATATVAVKRAGKGACK